MAMPQSDTVKAALWMLGAVVSFSSMAIAGREMGGELDTFEIMTYRSLIGLIIVLGITIYLNRLTEINRQFLGLHVVRNLCHFAGQNLWFYAVTVIPLAHLFAFEFTVPIWVLLAAPLLLSEKLTVLRVFSVMVGFVGILIVTRPWIAGFSIGLLAAAFSAVCFAGSVIATKQLTRTQSIICILFWLTALQLVFGIICAGYDGDMAIPSAQALPWVFVVGFGGLFAHFCLTTALNLAPASVVLPVDFTRLPIIAVIGMLFYDEPLDIWVIIGAIIIFGSNYMNIWAETRKKWIAP